MNYCKDYIAIPMSHHIHILKASEYASIKGNTYPSCWAWVLNRTLVGNLCCKKIKKQTCKEKNVFNIFGRISPKKLQEIVEKN